MNFLVVSRTRNITEAIIGTFMPLGVDILHASDYESAEPYVLDKKLGMVFIDFDIDDNMEYGMAFLDEVIEEQAEDLPTIVVVSTHINREQLQSLIEKRIKDFLIKPLDEATLVKRLLDIKNRFHFVDMDKKYYRVSPSLEQPLHIYLRPRRSVRLVKGVVRNISIGGASFSTAETIPDSDLAENDLVERIVLKLPRVDAELGGKIVYKLDNIYAVSFRQFDNENLRLLSNYIFNNISRE